MKLRYFRVLTFDCYGTLIDWESGIFTALQPLLQRCSPAPSRNAALEAFARHESAQEREAPAMIYSELLARVHARLAREWGGAADASADARFGGSVPEWPAFPDSARALAYLKQHYQLVILSNVDRASFAGSNKRLGVTFDAIYTAQDVGSYKPDPRNFEFMLAHLGERGIAAENILHTAQSLFHDHAPAKKFGLATCWIDRRHAAAGWGATMPPPDGAAYDFRFPSLEAMAAAHRGEMGA
jgi:2-haloalkanoic acid dehalogenase type II